METHSLEGVSVVPAPGTWIPFTVLLPPEPANITNAASILAESQPRPYAPNNTKECLLSIMPATCPTVPGSFLSAAPIQLAAPIKGECSLDKPGIVANGFRSGARSCVIPCRILPPVTETSELSSDAEMSEPWVIAVNADGERYLPDPSGTVLIRLKGCGMWLHENKLPYPGITLQPAIGQDKYDDIRGVCFLHTAASEQFACGEIEQMLSRLGLTGGNRSLGFWIYSGLRDDPAPLITKAVSLFDTVGDRRVEAHLMNGMEQLVVKRVSEPVLTRVLAAIRELYVPGKEPCKANAAYVRIDRIPYRYLWDYLQPLLNTTTGAEYPPANPDSLLSYGFVDPRVIYDALAQFVAVEEDPQAKEEIAVLYGVARLWGRVGWETGRLLAAVHRTGRLWGTYADRIASGFHCNAHCDNLVVLSPEHVRRQAAKRESTDAYQLIAPVDFDMSFRIQDSVNLWEEPPHPDPKYVTQTFFSELSSMAQDMGGTTSTHPEFWVGLTQHLPVPAYAQDFIWAVHDCAVFEMFRGYQFPADPSSPYNNITMEEALEFERQSLELSKDIQS